MRWNQPCYAPSEDGGAPAEVETQAQPAAVEASEPEDDGEDYEYEGEKYRLPKKLAAHVREGHENGLRERDYRHKTGETAEMRRALESERKQYQDSLKAVQQHLEGVKPSKPDPSMLDPNSEKYDRDSYYRQRDQYDAWEQRVTANKQALEVEEGRNKSEAEKAKAERMSKENAALVKAIPEWSDQTKRMTEIADIGKFSAAEYNLTPEEFNGIDDHRVLVALRDAMMYRKGLQKAATIEAPADPVKPLTMVKRVAGTGGAGEPLSDRQSIDNWMKARSKQVQAKRR